MYVRQPTHCTVLPENTWTQVKNPAVQQRLGIRAALDLKRP